mmetsp:Transcript_9373/g.30562  ORF Transcript_9373/g.30562 Transcript_9373/m.30562 type:complete len:317 (-) Transcript_9373:139-1089(-)
MSFDVGGGVALRGGSRGGGRRAALGLLPARDRAGAALRGLGAEWRSRAGGGDGVRRRESLAARSVRVPRQLRLLVEQQHPAHHPDARQTQGSLPPRTRPPARRRRRRRGDSGGDSGGGRQSPGVSVSGGDRHSERGPAAGPRLWVPGALRHRHCPGGAGHGLRPPTTGRRRREEGNLASTQGRRTESRRLRRLVLPRPDRRRPRRHPRLAHHAARLRRRRPPQESLGDPHLQGLPKGPGNLSVDLRLPRRLGPFSPLRRRTPRLQGQAPPAPRRRHGRLPTRGKATQSCSSSSSSTKSEEEESGERRRRKEQATRR